MADNKNTQYFKVNNETDIAVKDILEAVYIALTEKGYNPVNQIVGYIVQLRTSEHRSMYSYVRLSIIDVQLRTSEHRSMYSYDV